MKPAATPARRLTPVPVGLLQRKCSCGGSVGSGGDCAGCEKKKLQRRAAGVGPDTAPPIVHEVLGSAGQPLDAQTRAFFEPRFGHDFGQVRVHDDAKAVESAHAVNAHAYTVGRNVVFASRPSLGTQAARALLAHELTHVVQQLPASEDPLTLPLGRTDSPYEKEADHVAEAVVSNRASAPPVLAAMPVLQKEPNPNPNSGGVSSTCDKDHADAIKKAQGDASGWVGKAVKWVESHRDRIKKRAPSGDNYNSVGPLIFGDLQLLEKHFRISEIISGEMKTLFPSSPDSTGSFKDFNNWGRADYFLLSKLRDVKIGDLDFDCAQVCPKGEKGAETLGRARAGSNAFTIFTNCFDRQVDQTKTGVVLHEAFHASFSDFDHDTYSFDGAYPGPAPRTNAESYATFAAVAATGAGYRVIVLPETVIQGSPNP
jgi:hypothetical protein